MGAISPRDIGAGQVQSGYPVVGSRCSPLYVLLATCFLGGCGGRQPSAPHAATDADPRVAFATPYLNVRPDVQYVGDAACAKCHGDIAASYHHHPMGRSMAPASGVPERLEKSTGNPFEKLGVEFIVERRGERVVHKATRRDGQGHSLTDLDAEVQFTLGSGANGKSYLINRDGYLYQSPISWYTQKQTWDLSPGFASIYPQQRAITVDCLFCHANRVELVEGSLNHFREPVFRGYSIGCERCHGPGALHVQSRRKGDHVDPDYTIVNPRRLEPQLRDAVCEQCHLQGEDRVLRHGRAPFDFRPGLPFHLFISVFVRKMDWSQKQKAVGQVEQMYASQCYQASKRQLGCISCHDPHDKPAADEAVAHYREACLACHATKNCSLPLAARRQKTAEDSCIVCHMPRSGSSDIVHTAVTDHRILRKPETPIDSKQPAPLQPGEIPLVHFHREFVDPDDKDIARDLGITLVQLARNNSAAQGQLGKLALPMLENAVQIWPDDVPAREALGAALWSQGRGDDALATFEKVIERSPGREQSLLDAVVLTEHLNQEEKAIALWRRVIAVNPWIADAHYRLSSRLAQKEQWREAIAECQKAIRIDPTLVAQRVLLITCYVRSGQKDKAPAEFAAIETLKPPDLDVLRRWFEDQTK